MRRSALRPFATTLTMIAAAACNRAPQEPAPAASARPQEVVIGPASSAPAHAIASARPPLPPDRCVKPTPDAPPRPAVTLPSSRCPADPDAPVTMPVVTVIAPDAIGGTAKVSAELARPPRDTEHGLMYRQSLGEDQGMLFDLQERRDHTFWMHNTCIPLDMIFLDEDGLVVGIVENARPMSDELLSVGCPSAWVLEVNAGWSRRHGVRAGQRMVLPPHA